MFSKNIIALISNKIQYFLCFVQKNHVTYFTVMKEPAFSCLGSMWTSTPTNCAPIVLYEVSIFVLIVGCDAHIAPKKFNIIAFSAEKHLASHAGEVASAVCAEVGGVKLSFIRISRKPLSRLRRQLPYRGAHEVSSTPTNRARYFYLATTSSASVAPRKEATSFY